TTIISPTIPLIGRTDFKNFDFGIQGTGALAKRATATGMFTGFRQFRVPTEPPGGEVRLTPRVPLKPLLPPVVLPPVAAKPPKPKSVPLPKRVPPPPIAPPAAAVQPVAPLPSEPLPARTFFSPTLSPIDQAVTYAQLKGVTIEARGHAEIVALQGEER